MSEKKYENAFSLSRSQLNIWDLEQTYCGTPMNNISSTMFVDGRLDVPMLTEAINYTIKNDGSLRLRLFTADGKPMQYSADYAEEPVPVFDFTGTNREGFLRWQLAETSKRMQLIETPLYEFAVFRTAKDSGGVLMKTHHIISDGWTQVMLANRIAKKYLSLLEGTEIDDAPVFNYQSHVEHEQKYLASPACERDRDYWREKQLSCPSAMKSPSGAALSPVGARLSFELPEMIDHGIVRFCTENRVSPFSVICMAFAVYMKRTGRSDDIAVGVPVLNRVDFEEKNTSGMFVSTLPFSFKFDDELSFNGFVENMTEEWYDLLRHQRLPFDEIMALSGGKRLFSTVISFQDSRAIKSGDAKLTLSGRWNYSGYQSEQLIIHLSNLEERGRFSIDYDYLVQLFSEKEITTLHECLVRILSEALKNPYEPLWKLSLLDMHEENAVLFGFNSTDAPLREKSVAGAFAKVASKHAERAALIFRGERVTYGKLSALAGSISGGVGRLMPDGGKLIGISIEKSPLLIAAMIGISASGNSWVVIDPALAAERRAEMASHCAIVVAEAGVIPTDGVRMLYTDAIMFRNEPVDPCDTSPDDMAYVVYTSGSTGKPKGAMLTHGGLLNFAAAMGPLYGFGGVLSLCSIGFDAFLIESISALLNGRTVILADSSEQEDPVRIAELIRGYAAGFISLTPSRISAYMREPAFAQALRRLDSIILGGESISSELLARIAECTEAQVYNQYGPSEATVGVSCKLLNGSRDINAGAPMRNCRLYVLDKRLIPLPIGVFGDLYIGGICVGLGYVDDEENTKSSFLQSPFEPGERLYRTGDIACFNGKGEIILSGRSDSQLKIRGLRIEPDEISARMESYPGVKSAAVKAVDTGKGTFIAGYYAADEPIAETKLLAFLSSYLPRYMIPAALVKVDEIPLSKNGKADTRLLPEPKTATGGAPAGAQEARILQLFKDVLGRDDIGMMSDYFLSGGDSLMATALIASIEHEFSTILTVSELYALRTPKRVAELLFGASPQAAEEDAIQAAPQMACYPLSSTQTGIYFESSIDKTGLSYNMPGALRMESVDKERLENAFRELIASEEILRTSFAIKEGGLAAVIAPNADFSIETIEAETFGDASEKFLRPFDLGKAPLLRAAVWESGDGVVIFTDMHHIIADGAGALLLIKKLDHIYSGGAAETPRITYKDYAWWQKQREGQDAGYWCEYLAGASENAELPCDEPRGEEFDYAGDSFAFTIENGDRIGSYCREAGISPFSLLLGALGILAGRLSGSTDVLIGVPMTVRDRGELTEMLGPLITTLPLRMRPENDMTVRDYLANVWADVRNMMDHGDVSLSEIMKENGGKKTPYNILLSKRPGSTENFELGGARAEYIPVKTGSCKMDLVLEVSDSDYRVNVDFASSVFKRGTVELWMRSYAAVIDEITAGAEKLGDLTALSRRDRIVYFDRPNRQFTPFIDKCIDELIDDAAHCDPDAAAVIFKDSVTTFADLMKRAEAIAGFLQSQGADKGDVIAFCMKRGPEMVAAMYGILKAGCAYMPVLSSFPESRLEYMLNISGARLLICDEASSAELPQGTGRLVLRDESFPFVPVDGRSSADDIHVLFTSGSTGRPKGAVLPHRALANLLPEVEKLFGAVEGPILATSNCIFDTFITDTLLSLALGRTIVMTDEEQMMLPWELAALIKTHGCEIIQLTPSRMQTYLGNDEFKDAISRIKVIFSIGEANNNRLMDMIRKATDALVFNMYGPTETAVYMSVAELSRADRITIGTPIGNCRIYLLDRDMRRVLPTAVGEIYIAGICLAREYIGAPELTANSFLPDPFFPGEMMYKTGDMARLLADGRYEFAGRRDNQVKLNGQRIELDEITGEMMRSGIAADAATVAVRKNDGTMELRAFFIPKDGGDEGALREHLKKHLPKYMIPSELNAVSVIPKTDTGKTDKRSLAGMADKAPKNCRAEDTAIAPAAEQQTAELQDQAPDQTKKCDFGDIRAELVEIWRSSLERDDIKADVSFFDQGGTSLAALGILSKYFAKGFVMTLSEFYGSPTIEAQIPLIEKRRGAGSLPETKVVQNTVDTSSGAEPKKDACLVTGAAGYLGGHLVRELIRAGEHNIYCMIHSDEQKLFGNLEYLFGASWLNANRRKLIPVKGEITSENMGIGGEALPELTARVHTVIHAAADVRHYGARCESVRINVGGTENAIKLCRDAGAKLLYISTMSNSGEYIVDEPAREAVFTEDDTDIGQNWRDNIYVNSKFLAEQAVNAAIEQGLDCKVFRVGRLVGRSEDGVFQKNREKNSFYLFVKGLVALDCIPAEFAGTLIEMTPVDECARGIVALRNSEGRVFHMFNPYQMPLRDFVAALGKHMAEVSREEYESALAKAALTEPPQVMAQLLDVWNRIKLQNFVIRIDNRKTTERLRSVGLAWSRPELSVWLAAFDVTDGGR